VFDLDAYLARIGLSGRPSLDQVHRAHVSSILFESLDPFTGLSVSLDPEDVFEKLVRRRRGGYCFEQNLLLATAMRALGAEVKLHLGRVLFAAEPGVLRARTHLVLQVRHEGRSLLADAGFGGGTLLEPLPWGPGEEHEQAGWRYRILERQSEHVLQAFRDGRWSDLYAYLPDPVPAVELEPANWWTSTNPSSRFVTGFLVGRQWADGRRLVLTDWGQLSLTEATAASVSVTTVSFEQIPALLDVRFELPGFALDGDGHLACPAG
jgi:N-hydroxyarylamine O-acetyltransferase